MAERAEKKGLKCSCAALSVARGVTQDARVGESTDATCAHYALPPCTLLTHTVLPSPTNPSPLPPQDTLADNGMELTVSCVSDLKEGKPWMMCREEWISIDEALNASYADGEAGDFDKMVR